MSTYNIGFYEEISKISLNYHQISSKSNLSLSSVIPIGRRTRSRALTNDLRMNRVWLHSCRERSRISRPVLTSSRKNWKPRDKHVLR